MTIRLKSRGVGRFSNCVAQECRRTVEQVHTSELELAIVNLIRDTGGITSDDATTHVARLYGWNRTGSEIRSRLGTTLEKLVASGSLDRNGAELVVANR